MLTLDKVSKEYLQGETKVTALKEISFKVAGGETLSLVGSSGSGKTTLLSLLAGLERPTSGTIELKKQFINSMTEDELCNFRAKELGIVFQQFHLMPHLSAIENILLPLEIREEDNTMDKGMEILKSIGLENRKNHFPSQLSGGECQRVAMGRALVGRPAFLLADEPSGNLDAKTGKQIMDLLFDQAEKMKTTLILVTHDLELAKRCQTQISLASGSIQ